MKGFFSLFTSSAKEFKSVRTICVTGLLIAVSMMLESVTIEIPNAKINFAYLAIAAIGMLYGPTVSFFSGALCDLVGYIAHPDGGFLPAYIIPAMLQGLIYGVFLYRAHPKRASFYIRVIAARLLDVLVINLCLNTLLNIHYGFLVAETVAAGIWMRVVKNLIQFCADVPISIAVLTAVSVAYLQVQRVSSRAKV